MSRDRRVVVFGATGLVGRRLAEHFLEAGCTVVAQGRDRDKLADLAASAGDGTVITVPCDLANDDDVEDFRRQVGEHLDGVDGSVAAIGGWSEGPPLTELPVEQWNRTLGSNLTSHLLAARAVTPLLRGERRLHLMLNGDAGLEPFPGTGAMCVAGAGQTMLAALLRAEAGADGPAYGELFVLDNIDTEDDGSSLSHRVVARQVDAMLAEVGGPHTCRLSPEGDVTPVDT